MAELVPTARDQHERRNDEYERQRSDFRGLAPENTHEHDRRDVLHDEDADADVSVKCLFVATFLQDFDDDNGGRKAQYQRDIDRD